MDATANTGDWRYETPAAESTAMGMINMRNAWGEVGTRVLRVIKKVRKRMARIIRRVWRVGEDWIGYGRGGHFHLEGRAVGQEGELLTYRLRHGRRVREEKEFREVVRD
jgi:hypothetical protein